MDAADPRANTTRRPELQSQCTSDDMRDACDAAELESDKQISIWRRATPGAAYSAPAHSPALPAAVGEIREIREIGLAERSAKQMHTQALLPRAVARSVSGPQLCLPCTSCSLPLEITPFALCGGTLQLGRPCGSARMPCPISSVTPSVSTVYDISTDVVVTRRLRVYIAVLLTSTHSSSLRQTP